MYLLQPTDLLKLSFGSNWVQKTKTSIYEILRMLFSNMDFSLAHFANFNIAHFEIEESFCILCIFFQIKNWFSNISTVILRYLSKYTLM